MVVVLTLVIGLCAVAIAIGASKSRARWLLRLGGSALLYLVSTIAWWSLLYFQVVSFDPLLARFDIYRTEGLLGALIFFGPPLLPVVAFALLLKRASLLS